MPSLTSIHYDPPPQAPLLSYIFHRAPPSSVLCFHRGVVKHLTYTDFLMHITAIGRRHVDVI